MSRKFGPSEGEGLETDLRPGEKGGSAAVCAGEKKYPDAKDSG